MTSEHEPEVRPACFAPRAGREMAEMFDDVSGRYDLVNRIMTLGRDRAWREAMWRAIPEEARAVMDLCTGSGVSLDGLRRPGRLVIGADVSFEMLRLAAEGTSYAGWAPRLVCSDAFALPLRAGSIDGVTIAFGIRNLRPRAEALAEIARVLSPRGVVAILEGTAPAPGPFAPFHRFYLQHVVPLAGHLSRDAGAYRYLAASILDFDPLAFERDLAQAGFVTVARRSFLLGATRLWVARRAVSDGQIASISPASMQDAMRSQEAARARKRVAAERRAWDGIQALVAAALAVGLVAAMVTYAKWNQGLPLWGWRRPMVWVLLAGGAFLFLLRTLVLAARWREAGRWK
jgi:demethylmenaquinone methyltransferase/2-methoxy-6-polyprenyl-1,4-benzoquinol methylase